MNTPDSIPFKKTGSSRWKRRLKGLLFAVAGLITLLFLVLAVESLRGRLAWENYRAQLEARGENLDIETYRHSAPSDEENFAAIPVFQKTTADAPLFPWTWPRGDWTRFEVTDWSGWQREIRGGADPRARYGLSPQKPSQEVLRLRKSAPGDPVDDLFYLLNSRREILDQVRDAASRPYTRFNLEFILADASLPVLASAKQLAGAFRSRALAELSRGDPEAALADWHVLIRLAEAVGSEPLVIFHLVQIALLNASLQPVWEGLAREQWTEAELIEIERTLGGVNLSADLARTFRGERIFSLLNLESWPPRPPNGNSSAAPRKSWLALPLIYRNKLSIARMYQELFLPPLQPENRDFDLARIQALDVEGQERFSRTTPYNVLAAGLHSGIVMTSYKTLRMQASVELARAACALERFRLARRAYPDQLDELVPEFLPQVPLDLADGRPLRYRRTDDGRFILYSIGIDGEDHGGKIRRELDEQQPDAHDTPGLKAFQEAGDWVWQYPQGLDQRNYQ
jgi:hypothetical protein